MSAIPVLSELSAGGRIVTCPPQTYPVEKSDTGRIEGRQKCQEKITARSRFSISSGKSRLPLRAVGAEQGVSTRSLGKSRLFRPLGVFRVSISKKPPHHCEGFRVRLELERETRIELATLCLGSKCSTTELLPLNPVRICGQSFENLKSALIGRHLLTQFERSSTIKRSSSRLLPDGFINGS